ncbi:MAG: beta-lactamase domain-containing protein [Parcubacteria group bacterium Greene0714_7]|nr:MAG: beta-lactamase domain-containing protein [Parcubacteria group bacterium Greene0714_7]
MARIFLIGLLIFGNIFVWTVPIPHGLKVSFLNIGQGDSIFIEGPTGIQMLVDAGPPDKSVLRELGSVMPMFDRSIDAMVETHPDQDHLGGIPDVFERYRVETFLEPDIPNDTKATKATVLAVQKSGVKKITARRGMRLILGGGAYADILFPDRDVSKIETNTGSIVMRVVYGNTSFLLNGDSPQVIEKYLVSIDGKNLQSTILKAGHHGSKNSSAPEFVKAVNPEYGIFSRGCDNKYGHPASRVGDLFQSLDIPILDTCKNGRVTFLSDGHTLKVAKY